MMDITYRTVNVFYVLMVVRTAKQASEAHAPPAMAGIHCPQDHVPLALTETVVFAMSPIPVTFVTMVICFSPTIPATCVSLRDFTDTRMLISLLAALLVLLTVCLVKAMTSCPCAVHVPRIFLLMRWVAVPIVQTIAIFALTPRFATCAVLDFIGTEIPAKLVLLPVSAVEDPQAQVVLRVLATWL